MNTSYLKILKKLSEVSGIEEDEINRRVEAKRARLSGLISPEGALQVIAAELGVSFENEKLKIDELLPEMRRVNFSGKVVSLSPIRTFKTRDGGEGKVANMLVADETSNIKVVLWDTNHIALIESGEIGEGVSVEISGGNMRQNEVHMGSFSELKLSEEKFENVQSEKQTKEKKISDFAIGERVKVRAFVVQSFEPRFFEVNKETGRKVTEEEKANGAITEKRAILNIVVDDGTENIRAVLFHEKVRDIGLTELEDEVLRLQQRENLHGKEIIFIGEVRNNSYFNTPELIVDEVKEVDLDNLIEELEN
jgi:ssDNA-binding replication factor A large subunit